MRIFQRIKHSIVQKVFWLIVLSIGASLVVSMLVVKKLERAYSNYVYEAKRDLLDSAMAGIEDKLIAYENGTYQFITNDRIQGYASSLREAYEIQEEVETQTAQEEGIERPPEILEEQTRANRLKTSSLMEILKELDTILASGYKVEAGYFVDLSGKLYKGYGASNYEIPEAELQRILERAREKSGSVCYGAIQAIQTKGDRRRVIYLSRILRERKNLSMEYCGTVIYLIAPEELAASFLMEHDDLVILNEEGETIFSSLSQQALEDFSHDSRPETGGYKISDLDGKKYFITSLSSKRTGWQYYNFSDYWRQFSFIHNMDIFYTLILLGILLVIGMLAACVSVNLVQPIVELSGRIEAINQDSNPVQALHDQGKRRIKKRNDEIGRLEESFARMTRQLGELIHENYEQKLYLQDAQLSALRSKLNPHFLYNTLDTIRWLATEETYQQIPGIVKALGDILRISMNSKEALIPVRQELEYMRGYLVIQRARFGERLKVRIDVEEDMMEAKLPAFSLQPLVENAVKYVVENISEPCRIKVEVREERDGMFCAVSDNGPGMDLEIIEKLKAGELKAQGNGIGLINLDERLRSLYGSDCGITVERNQEGGATVSFRVKKEAAVEHGAD